MAGDKAGEFAPADFFVVRTPLLPFEELEHSSSGLQAASASRESPEGLAQALRHDRELLRQRLRDWIARAEIREALFVASPGLEKGLSEWLRHPDSKKGRVAEESLVRYFLRMVTRSTPFGMVAGFSLGSPSSLTRLDLVGRDRYERHSRLDMQYLCGLASALSEEPVARETVIFRTDPSLYPSGDRLKHFRSSREGTVLRHRIVAVAVATLRLAERVGAVLRLTLHLAAQERQDAYELLAQAADYVRQARES